MNGTEAPDFEKHHRSEGFPSRAYLVPGRDAPRARPNGESSWQTVAAAAATAAAVAAVTWMGMTQIQGFRQKIYLNLTKY